MLAPDLDRIRFFVLVIGTPDKSPN